MAELTLPRISFDGLNVGTYRSGKKTESPVLGFRAFFGIRCFTPNVPNPRSSTFLFPMSEPIMVSITPFITAAVSTLVSPVDSET